MIELLRLILHIIASFFNPRTKLVAEILSLRQQLNVLRRQVSKRPQLSNTDRLLFVWLYRWFPSVLSAFAILRPETIIRWHRAGFQSYWRERSRKPVGRPRISAELRNFIGAMSRANHLWGAPHIHGELLKLGFTIAQSTVARYMYRGWPPSQGWRTFLTNHLDGIAAIDLFVLPTITFRLLYCLVILRHGRRLWVSFGRSRRSGRQAAHMAGDPRNVAPAVKEAFQLTRNQFSVGQPLLPLRQHLIDALYGRIVRRKPRREVGQFRGERRINLGPLGCEPIALDLGGVVSSQTAGLLLLPFYLTQPLAEATHSLVHADIFLPCLCVSGITTSGRPFP